MKLSHMHTRNKISTDAFTITGINGRAICIATIPIPQENNNVVLAVLDTFGKFIRVEVSYDKLFNCLETLAISQQESLPADDWDSRYDAGVPIPLERKKVPEGFKIVSRTSKGYKKP